jgi:hypothetical protein
VSELSDESLNMTTARRTTRSKAALAPVETPAEPVEVAEYKQEEVKYAQDLNSKSLKKTAITKAMMLVPVVPLTPSRKAAVGTSF